MEVLVARAVRSEATVGKEPGDEVHPSRSRANPTTMPDLTLAERKLTRLIVARIIAHAAR